ncbi:hypothetical protein BGS_1319, partial [Beggiatoa sp. SS]
MKSAISSSRNATLSSAATDTPYLTIMLALIWSHHKGPDPPYS